MNRLCIICVAITGSLPRKENNPAVPINVAEQIESTHAAFEAGVMEPATFYESPFTDLDDMGIAGIFDREQTSEIIQIVRMLNAAVAA